MPQKYLVTIEALIFSVGTVKAQDNATIKPDSIYSTVDG